MKKYIVKYKDSGKVFGEYASKEEASDKVMEYIRDHYISPFDFVLEEVACKEVNEVITDFESARKALGIKPNDDYLLVSGEHHGKEHDSVERLVRELNPKHIEALVALNRLFTIAEAWNKEDNFVPDFSDCEQYKWFPWFEHNNYSAGFVCMSATYTLTAADATFGQRICFKTSERAEQFGKQFENLYNKVFLLNK